MSAFRPVRDVAIYSPASGVHYEAAGAPAGRYGGGAEVQMYLLGRELSRRGLHTAQIVWPVRDPIQRSDLPDLVERGAYVGDRGRWGLAGEAWRIWRGLAKADAKVCVIRGGGPQLLVAAAFSAAYRRKLVFSSASGLDFDLERTDRSATHLRLYGAALHRPDAFVVQTREQRELARNVFPGAPQAVEIPSFVEQAEPTRAEPEAFLWIGRLDPNKRPLEVARLAEAMPEVRFRMVYTQVLETPAQMPGELERAASRLPNLELLGAVERPRVLSDVARSYAVISTSRREGMPNVFLEAWARGIPVASLSYDPDGRIRAREMGVVAGGSLERMVEGLRALMRDRELRARMGRNGLAYVNEVHAPAVVGERWAVVLRGMI